MLLEKQDVRKKEKEIIITKCLFEEKNNSQKG